MADLPVHLTYDDAVIGLQRAVMEKGEDHVFSPEQPDDPDTYFYFDPKSGECGCIVGHVLSYYGITKEDLGKHNQGTGFGTILRLTPRVVTCDPAAKALLQAAQEDQDSGATWGQAVEDSVSYAEELAD